MLVCTIHRYQSIQRHFPNRSQQITLLRVEQPHWGYSKQFEIATRRYSMWSTLAASCVTNKQLLVQNNFRAKIIGRRIFQSILLNNNTLIIINNTKEKNCCYFPIEYRTGKIIYYNKTLKIVCDVTFCFFDNFDVTALKSSRPRVAGCARMRENLVQFSSKEENQARIITLVNNQYQNYYISLNYFFCHIIFET